MKIFAGTSAPISNILLPMATSSWNLGGIVSSSDSPNVLLVGFSVDDLEATDVRRCFDDVSHIFAFGRSLEQSLLRVRVLHVLGARCGGGGSTTLKSIRDGYNAARIYMSGDPITANIANSQFSGFLVGMHVGEVDTNTQTCMITFDLMLDEDK